MLLQKISEPSTEKINAPFLFRQTILRYNTKGAGTSADRLNPAHSWPGIVVRIDFSGSSIGVRMNDNAGYYNVVIDGKSFGVFHGDKSGNR